MKSFRALVFAGVLSTASAAEIPAGTHLLVRMEHSVSTRTAKVGDGVHLRTSTPVSAGGKIVVPVGSWVSGTIKRVNRSGRLHGRARLEIEMETLVLPTGAAVHIPPLIAVAAAAPSAPRRYRGLEEYPSLPVAAGLLAGFAGGSVAGALSHDEETAAKAGLGLGVAAAVTTGILLRNRDVEFNNGTSLDVVFERAVPLD
jgi:hypothetical protein